MSFEEITKNLIQVDCSEKVEAAPCRCSADYACRGDHCINRALKIECNILSCPARGKCNNRRLQSGRFKKIQVFDAGKKGKGLCAAEDIRTDELVIEYIGEMVDHTQFMARCEIYEAEGEPHFYSMTINRDLIIDATRKGNSARYINHSCNPNCHVQKWTVDDQPRMAIFSIKEIKSGAELTFDYKFVRIGGRAQLCFCGEENCKGIIGTVKDDTLNTNVKTHSVEDLISAMELMKNSTQASALLGEVLTLGQRALGKFIESGGVALITGISFKVSEQLNEMIFKVLEKLPFESQNAVSEAKLLPFISHRFKDEERKNLVEKLEKLEFQYKIPRREEAKEYEELDKLDFLGIKRRPAEENPPKIVFETKIVKKDYLRTDSVKVATEAKENALDSAASTPNSTQRQEGAVRDQISAIVVDEFSRYKGKFSKEHFKSNARKLTHSLLEKEMRLHGENCELGEKKKMKIREATRTFIKEIMKKINKDP